MEFDQWKTGLFWKISGGQEPGCVQQRWRLPWLWLRPPLVSSTSNPCFKAERKVQGMLRRSHGGPELERRLRMRTAVKGPRGAVARSFDATTSCECDNDFQRNEIMEIN
ncbi:hypothetical protein Q3G72_020136 [Acer saccharum]|nr:hypothetical protein Q3G72_020136 [Acer saccharum]